MNDTITNNDDEHFIPIAKAHLIITMFGIIGNAICICVFFQKSFLTRKFNLYLLILAIAELFFCCTIFANTIVYIIEPPKMLSDLSIIPCYIIEYLINSIDAFCVFLTLLLSIDRLKAILDPLNSRQFFTNRYPKQITFVSLFVIFILKSPDIILSQTYFISNELQLTENNTNCNIENITQKMLPICHQCDNQYKEMYIIVCGIILPLLLNITPTIIILVINIILLVHVTQYKKKGLGLVNKQKNKNVKKLRQKSHYITIIIIGVWLLLTSAPYYTINTIIRVLSLKVFQQNEILIGNGYYFFQAIASIFFNSNHCINIIIYIFFHNTFRYNSLKLMYNIFKCNSSFMKKYVDEGRFMNYSFRASSVTQSRSIYNLQSAKQSSIYYFESAKCNQKKINKQLCY